ncbi:MULTISPECIES: hypothetical protein [unclassified Curtobacterium]|uniref:hypothetical protein n=1 Tax=unclassified Curtobacterium TaxID=257496 RepID=UPI0038210340
MTRSRRRIVATLSGAAAVVMVLGQVLPALQQRPVVVWSGVLVLLLVALVVAAVTARARRRGRTDR